MFRGFLSTWAGLIVNGIVTILLTRVLVHGLGNFYYGLWVLVSSVLDYYGLLDMGVRYSMQRFVARYGGANERNALNETFMTGVSMAACIATAAFILCAILLIVLPGFFGLTGESRTLFRVLLTIQTVTLALDFPSRIMGAYLCGLHRFDLYNGAGIIWGISRGIVFWAVIHLGGKVSGIAISQLIIVACMFVLYWLFVKLADPQLSLGWKHTSWARTKELIHFSVFVFVSDVGDRLRLYTDCHHHFPHAVGRLVHSMECHHQADGNLQDGVLPHHRAAEHRGQPARGRQEIRGLEEPVPAGHEDLRSAGLRRDHGAGAARPRHPALLDRRRFQQQLQRAAGPHHRLLRDPHAIGIQRFSLCAQPSQGARRLDAGRRARQPRTQHLLVAAIRHSRRSARNNRANADRAARHSALLHAARNGSHVERISVQVVPAPRARHRRRSGYRFGHRTAAPPAEPAGFRRNDDLPWAAFCRLVVPLRT